MKISVCIPSYKRPKVETLKYLPFAKVWVDEGEAEEYRKENPGANIIACPKGVQGNVSRIRNYILDQEEADAVVILDDDMKGIFYHESGEEKKVEAEEFLEFIEKYTRMARDIKAHLWGVNLVPDKKAYREYTPFSTVSPILGPFQCFVDNAGGLRYDEALPLKEDYDMSLQQLNKYRVILRVNKFFYKAKQSIQAGGCATYRNYERELQQFKALQKKWGGRIIKEDRTSKKNGKKFDYNPVMRVPIKGV